VAQFSRRALRTQAAEAESGMPTALEVGPRAEELANTVRAHEALREPEIYAAEIRKLWTEASRKFLAIGEYLLQAQRVFRHGDKMRRLQEMLPFSYSTANRLMRVAEAVHEHRLRREQLPAHYPTAYALTTLSDDELREAERRNLVTPDVQRREIEAFIREIRGVSRRAKETEERGSFDRADEAWRRAHDAINAACEHVANIPGAAREHEELCRLSNDFKRAARGLLERVVRPEDLDG
jgi:Protein of unknown function (DUF3102)